MKRGVSTGAEVPAALNTEHRTSNVEHRIWGAFLMVLLALLLGSLRAETTPAERASAIVVVGAGGEESYAEAFAGWAEDWQKACAAGDVSVTSIGAAEKDESFAAFRAALSKERPDGAAPLWIVLLGHGTHDGREAKFNLRGDDLAATELAKLLQPITRPVVVVAAFSSSGAFLAPLAGPKRIVVTATKSGSESNYARFGKHLSAAMADPSADLDHDGQTSLLEAWLSAAQRVADFYKSEGRLATEHSLLDDNGDGRGTPAEFFQGTRLVKKSKDGAAGDGLRAHQIHLVPAPSERALPLEVRARRDALEQELAALREAKDATPAADYAVKLEEVLLRLARLYREAGAAAD